MNKAEIQKMRDQLKLAGKMFSDEMRDFALDLSLDRIAAGEKQHRVRGVFNMWNSYISKYDFAIEFCNPLPEPVLDDHRGFSRDHDDFNTLIEDMKNARR